MAGWVFKRGCFKNLPEALRKNHRDCSRQAVIGITTPSYPVYTDGMPLHGLTYTDAVQLQRFKNSCGPQRGLRSTFGNDCILSSFFSFILTSNKFDLQTFHTHDARIIYYNTSYRKVYTLFRAPLHVCLSPAPHSTSPRTGVRRNPRYGFPVTRVCSSYICYVVDRAKPIVSGVVSSLSF
jgi:hypothetical protein